MYDLFTKVPIHTFGNVKLFRMVRKGIVNFICKETRYGLENHAECN